MLFLAQRRKQTVGGQLLLGQSCFEMLVKLQPRAFFSFLFRHLKGNIYTFSKASEKLSLFYEECVRYLGYLCNYTNEVVLFIVF